MITQKFPVYGRGDEYMKKVLTILFYPLLAVLGVLGANSAATADVILLTKDIATDRGYDGQEIYDRIEHRNS
ncbi:hypothetical protein [Paenibacillus taichungensis]|uniref:hypothetical protein n=2 Tax=Paenibacillus taichungensis TaxID=484184 RepID=UPI003D9A653A